MKPLYFNEDLMEYRRYSKNKSFAITDYETTKPYLIEPHWHNSIEIIYVVHGSVSVQHELFFFEMKSNDIIYIPSSSVHGIRMEPNTRIILFQISSAWLHEVIPSFLSYDIFLCSATVVSPEKKLNYKKFIEQFLILKDIFYSENEACEIGINGCVFLLIHLMISQFKITTKGYEEDRFKYQHRVKEISKFVNEHYQEDIRLDDLANKLGVSSQYLSKIFKKYYKINFKDFLTKIRLEHAVYEMSTTNHSLIQISENCGFSSQHAFIYSFKNMYNITPGQFRATLTVK